MAAPSRKSGERLPARTPAPTSTGMTTAPTGRFTASSSLVALNGERGKIRRMNADQAEAQLMFDAVGEVRKAVTSRGALLSGCAFTIGLPPLPDDDEGRPTHDEEDNLLDPTIDPRMLEVANAALRNIVDVRGSQKSLIDAQSQNWDITGEAYIVAFWINAKGAPVEEGAADADRQRWEIVGSGAYREESKRMFLRLGRSGSEIRLPTSAYVARTWKRHPVWPDEPHGWVMSALPSCRSLLAYSLAERSQALSSAVGTIHLVPSEAAPQKPVEDGADLDDDFHEMGDTGGAMSADEWAAKLDRMVADVVGEVMDDWQSGRAVQGGVLAVEGKFIEMFGTSIDIGRKIDTGLGAQTDRALQRIREQADCSPEMISGLGDTNRWNGKQIDESDYRRYHRPQIEAIAESWTAEIIWPAIMAAGFTRDEARKVQIIVNKNAIVAPPDRSKFADAALRLGAVGWEGYRQMCDIPDRFAPSEEELAAIIGYFQSVRVSPTSTSGSQGGSGGAPDNVNPVNDEAAALMPPRMLAAIEAPAALVMTMGPDTLGMQLIEVERATREALAAAGEVAFDFAFSRAQGKFRNLARKHGRIEVPPGTDDVIGWLGVDRCTAILSAEFGADTDEERANEELFLLALVGFRRRFETIGTTFFGRALRVLGMDMPTSGRPSRSRFTQASISLDDITEAIAAAWDVLSESVSEWARDRIDGTGSSVIPDSIWRRVMNTFGGDRASAGTGPVVGPQDPPGPSAGVFGPTFAQLEPAVTSQTWVHHAVKPDPFREHLALDGIEVSGPEDPILSGAPWGHYWPGDHKGCMCDIVPGFETTT